MWQFIIYNPVYKNLQLSEPADSIILFTLYTQILLKTLSLFNTSATSSHCVGIMLINFYFNMKVEHRINVCETEEDGFPLEVNAGSIIYDQETIIVFEGTN